jgi:hypothetical protein
MPSKSQQPVPNIRFHATSRPPRPRRSVRAAREPGRYGAMVQIGNATFGALLVSLSGCCALGPCDGVFSISGSISDGLSQPCLLDVSPEGAGPNEYPRVVSGSFEENFIINPSRSGHRIQVICDEKTVASRLVHYGRDVGFGEVVTLGEIAP